MRPDTSPLKAVPTRKPRALGANALPLAFLYLTVMLSGAAVMILELLGTRIIGPFYGVSLYVWSALITVTLIALALGYYVGGYWADRATTLGLDHILLTAALTTAVIPFLAPPILTATNPLGMRVGGFSAALLLFTLPLTCMAMVGPFAIKQATRDIKGIGRAVGSIYAVSTIGSVIATMGLGFFLLPHFGTRVILFALSFALLALALLTTWYRRRNGRWLAESAPTLLAIVAVTVALATTNSAHSMTKSGNFTVKHEDESIYGWVRVVDDEKRNIRLLLSDSSVLSAMDLTHGRTLLGYQVAMGLLPKFRPQARDALLIGLGGGHVARELKAQGLNTDTIEIDPAVAQAALDYFHFQPTGAFVVGDARYEVKQLNKRYDIIIHDCFTGGSEPTHLLTVEMLSQLRSMLKDGGILVLNYVGYYRGEGSEAVASVHKTFKSLFPKTRVFITEKENFTDFIF